MDDKLKQKLAKNLVANNLGEAASFFLGLITIPIILKFLQSSHYGIFILLASVINYLSLMDLGVGAAVVRFIAHYQAKNNLKTLGKVLSSSWTFFLGVSLISACLLFFLTDFLILHIFQIAPELRQEAVKIFQLGSLLIFVRIIANFFNIVAHGYQRFDLYNIGKLVGLLGTTVGAVIGLAIKPSLITLVWIYIGSTIAEGSITLILLTLKEGKLPLQLYFSFDFFRPVIKFGGWKFLMALSSQAVNQFDKIIISLYLPTQFVTYYAVPQSLTRRLTSTLSVITEPLFPFASYLTSSRPLLVLQKLYQKAIRFANVLVMPIALFITIFARQILQIWLGDVFAEKAAFVLAWLSLGYLIISLTAVPVKVAEAKNKPQVTALFSLISAIVRLGLAFYMTAKYGLNGLAASLLLYALPLVVSFLWFVSQRILLFKTKEILLLVWKNYFLIFIISFLILLPLKYFYPSPQNIFSLILVFVIYELVTFSIFLGIGVLKKEELLGFKNHFFQKNL